MRRTLCVLIFMTMVVGAVLAVPRVGGNRQVPGVADPAVVDLNTTHRSSDGSDHSFTDQDVTSGASPTLDGANITGVDAATVDSLEGASLDLLDGTRARTAPINAGGNSLTNLDTTITLEMDDGSVVFVDGTDIFYVSADGVTTNDLTAVGVSAIKLIAFASTNFLVQPSDGTTMIHDTEVVDTDNIHNATTGIILFPETGVYVGGAVERFLLIVDQKQCNVRIFTNGVLAYLLGSQKVSGTDTPSLGGPFAINVTDTNVQYEINVLHADTVARNMAGSSDFFVSYLFLHKLP